MKSDTLSPIISNAHECVAFKVAQEYLANLRKDTDNSFGTLDGLMHAFHYAMADRVRRRAFLLGAKRCSFRPVLFRALVEGHVRFALGTDSQLVAKLRRIRSAQKAKERAEAMAEQATWVALPVAS